MPPRGDCFHSHPGEICRKMSLTNVQPEGAVDIEAWLRRLGLEQYAQAFRDNDVDAEILPDLTADDLIAIGVNSVGHRRKLLAAIATLREEPPPADPRAARDTTPH